MEVAAGNEKETIAAGEELGKLLTGGDIVLLDGDLGAGKTTFTKGIAIALGIKSDILSPTFTLLNSYQGALVLNHMDFYRIASVSEAEEAGVLEDIGRSDTITVIEWYKNINCIYRGNKVYRVDILKNNDSRIIKISGEKFV